MDLDLPAAPGTYALVMRAASSLTIEIGRSGTLHLHPGIYIYVGSAFGPGGLRARVGRHLKIEKKKHWHIDFLRPFLGMEDLWYHCGPEAREHAWAEYFRTLPGAAIPLPGFGASDCRCPAHLFFFEQVPNRPQDNRAEIPQRSMH